MSSNNPSDKVALLALISLIPIFIFVIGNGWETILAPYVQLGSAPFLDVIAAYLAGILFAVVAVILAWAVASERVRLRQDSTSKYSWIAYLGLLFVLSGLGTMNWLFKVSESSAFIAETAVKTEDSLTALNQLALGIVLPGTSTQFQRNEETKSKLDGLITQLNGASEAVVAQFKSDQVKAQGDLAAARKHTLTLLEGFETEVNNPLKPGCGEVAQNYIDQIKAMLGTDLNLPSGNCKEAKPEVLIQTYKEEILKAMDRHFGNLDGVNVSAVCVNAPKVKEIAAQIFAIIGSPLKAQGGDCPANGESIFSDTKGVVDHYIGALPQTASEDSSLKAKIVDISQRLEVQMQLMKDMYGSAQMPSKDEAAKALKNAWTEYRTAYKDLSGKVDASKLAALPKSIDEQRIDKIGAIANTIEILISRYDRFSTYPIVLGGILFDMILIAFFLRVEATRTGLKGLTEHEKRLRRISSSFNSTGRKKP